MRYAPLTFVVVALLVISPATALSAENKNFGPSSTKFNAYSLGDFRMANMALFLKARTEAILRDVSIVDKVLFRQCVRDAKTAVALSRCLRAVYRARQSATIAEKTHSVSSDASFLHKVMASVMDLLRGAETHDAPSMNTDMLLENPKPMKTKLKIQKLNAIKRSESKRRIRRSPRDSIFRTEQFFANLMNRTIPIARRKKEKTQTPKLRVLSPKLLSLIPDVTNDDPSNLVLSPSLLSLHSNEPDNGTIGADAEKLFSSLPNLMQTVFKQREHRDRLLNFLLEVTGIGAIAERLANQFEPLAEALREKHVPLASQMAENSDHLATLLEAGIDSRQKEEFKHAGYAVIDAEQMEMLGRRGQDIPSQRTPFRSTEELETQLEVEIDRIASQREEDELLARRRRKRFERLRSRAKRQLGAGETDGNFVAYILSPQFFVPTTGTLTSFNAEILTPWFFLTNVLAPEFFNAIILSPTIFEANLFYIQGFLGEVLSPTIMQANLLSVPMFDALVLSPQIMIVDVLTPELLSPHVLSPQILNAALLSPNIGVPSFMSDQQYVVNVLSPNFLSPNLRSYTSNYVDILSPDILSGGEENGMRFITVVLIITLVLLAITAHSLSVPQEAGEQYLTRAKRQHMHYGTPGLFYIHTYNPILPLFG